MKHHPPRIEACALKTDWPSARTHYAGVARLAALVLVAVAAVLPAHGQGTVVFNNRVSGTILTRVYGPENFLPAYQKYGNTAADTPAGTQVYTGAALSGNGWTAQLWAAPGADRPESELQPALPTTTFRTATTTVGQVNGVTATLMGVPLDCPVATVQMRVWPSSYGSWAAAEAAWPFDYTGMFWIGRSLAFNVTNIGGGTNSAPYLLGLRSFSLAIGRDLSPPRGPPVILDQPQSQSVEVGQNLTLQVRAAWAWSFQWRLNATNLLGATSAGLSLTNVQFDRGGTYSVVITNFLGQTVSSNATLTVVGPVAPILTSQPQAQGLVAGQNASFSVTVSGGVPSAYQWWHDTTAIPNATNATLIVSNVQPFDAGGYFVVVTNSFGSTTSSNATLTLLPPVPPSITGQPQDQAVAAGQNATFTVAVSGSPPFAYQWWRGDLIITGGTSSALILPSVQPGDAGAYSVVVTNAGGAITSSNATLTVLPSTPPSILSHSEDRTVPTGQTVSFSVAVDGTPPFAYQWWHANSVIPAATSSPLVLTNVQLADSGGYFVVVTNAGGSRTSTVMTLTVTGVPPSIVAQPWNLRTNVGAAASFVVSVTGTVPLHYQWRHNNNPIEGAELSQLVLPSVQRSDMGSYSVAVSNAYGFVESSKATLGVDDPAILAQPQNTNANLGETVSFSVTAAGTPPLFCQWRLNGVPIRGATTTNLVVTDIENVNYGLYSVVVSNAYGQVISSPGRLFSTEGGGGMVFFNNRVTGSTFSRVYGPELADPTIRKTGNTYTDTPAGNQLYTGSGLAGSNFIAQLWASRDADRPEAVLLPASPTTVFRTTPSTAGQVYGAIAVLANVPKDYPIATLQLRAWDSREGTITDWSQVLADPSIPRGLSQLFNLENIGGDLNVPPSLIGLQSFNLFVATNHGAELSAGSSSSQAAEPGFNLTVNGDFGALYLIEVSTNAGGDWSYLATVTNLYGKVKFTDPLAITNAPSRFYRALRLP